MLSQPFFKQEGSNDLQKLSKLQDDNKKKEEEIHAKKATIKVVQIDINKIEEEKIVMKREKDNLQSEVFKITHHVDPSHMTLDEVMRKLSEEDPSSFRHIMDDLKYTGKEPNWHKADFAEHMRLIQG